MPQISVREYGRLPLRAHQFLAGVPLHDAWAIDLPSNHPGLNLHAFVLFAQSHKPRLSLAARTLLRLRLVIGQLLGWDRESANQASTSFVARLTAADRAQSLIPPGSPDEFFRTVYSFENEQLSELANQTVHAALLRALMPTSTGYRLYLGIYVRPTGPFTPIYLAIIYPFRKLIIYPALLRSLRTTWERFNAESNPDGTSPPA